LGVPAGSGGRWRMTTGCSASSSLVNALLTEEAYASRLDQLAIAVKRVKP